MSETSTVTVIVPAKVTPHPSGVPQADPAVIRVNGIRCFTEVPHSQAEADYINQTLGWNLGRS